MTTKKSNSNETEVDQVLHQTEVGEVLLKYKVPIISGMGLILIAVFSYLYYGHYKQQAMEKESALVYQFEKEQLKRFTKNEINFDQFFSKFVELTKSLKYDDLLFAMVAETVEHLQKNLESEKALKVWEEYSKEAPSSGKVRIMLNFMGAMVCEDNQMYDKAITLLENNLAQGVKLLTADHYFHLGRFYKQKGDAEKAKSNFEYVVENFPNDNHVKMAKIYLSEI